VRLRQSGIRAYKSFFAFYSRGQREYTMLPRRRNRQSPDLEEERELSRGREMSRERGRQGSNPDVEREVRNLHARMEDMETSQR
jgi:hypothetical protein